MLATLRIVASLTDFFLLAGWFAFGLRRLFTSIVREIKVTDPLESVGHFRELISVWNSTS
jgi:hypothetical protein